jgi:hypothetical protein
MSKIRPGTLWGRPKFRVRRERRLSGAAAVLLGWILLLRHNTISARLFMRQCVPLCICVAYDIIKEIIVWR